MKIFSKNNVTKGEKCNVIVKKILNENTFCDCKIVDEAEDKSLEIKYLNLCFSDMILERFIIKNTERNLKDKNIIFKTKNIFIKIINDITYFSIQKFYIKIL